VEKKISEKVIRCAFDVSNTLGAGFLEKVYENALAISMEDAGLRVERQKAFSVCFKGREVGTYVADLVVNERLLVELKALSALAKDHEAQLMNYLKASGLGVGLLINFGTPRIGIKRIVWQHDDKQSI